MNFQCAHLRDGRYNCVHKRRSAALSSRCWLTWLADAGTPKRRPLQRSVIMLDPSGMRGERAPLSAAYDLREIRRILVQNVR